MSLPTHNSTVAERLMRYVQIDTESDPFSETQPSTEKQRDLSNLLVAELKDLGITDAELDENGYVYANVPATAGNENHSGICFCAHVDTSYDVTGKDVKPILHRAWDGSDIVLPDDNKIVISKKHHTYLEQRIGDDIITASGKTLLGADDKAGVAVIMDAVQYMMEHPELVHGPIAILFTPDEEIGRGVDAINMDKVLADFGYTLDGGARGSLEGENFSADGVKIIFSGVSAHPGYAKGKLISAIKVAAKFLDSLPKEGMSPETTAEMEGFFHPTHIEGGAETTTVRFIIRSFDTPTLGLYEQQLEQLAKEAVAAYPGAAYIIEVKEQYRNMYEVLKEKPQVMDLAQKAYEAAGISAERVSIRGGTDGARLSFMGLPCPNIFTGEMGIHSKQEYCSVQDMEKSSEICVRIAELHAQC